MKAKFSVVYLLMLLGLLIGCSETDHDLVSKAPSPSPQPFPSVVHQSDPSSMTEEHTPFQFPSEQENVAAGPMALPLLAPVVIPVVSCGAAIIDSAALVMSPFDFLSGLSNHKLMPIASVLSMACPAGIPGKAVRILKSSSTIVTRLKVVRKFSKRNYKTVFERFIGRPVKTGYDVDHSIPQMHREFLKPVIKVDHPALLIEVKRSFHQRISPAWRKAWDDFLEPFIKKDKPPSAQELLKHRDELLNQEMFKPLKAGNYIELTR